MTRASHQRIARRAESFEVGPAFVKPPPGMLGEEIDLEPFGLVLGLIHPEGSPLLIAAWDGQRMRRLLPEQASAWADQLVEAGQAVALAPVIEAIRKLVRRVGEIVTASIMRKLECEGTA